MIRRNNPFSRLFHLSPILLILAVAAATFAGCGGDSKPGTGSDSTAASGESGDAGTPASNEVASSFENADPVEADAAYVIRVKPKVGDVYTYRITQGGTVEFQDLKATEETVYNFTQRITGVNDDGSFTVEMRYDSIRGVSALPAGMVDSVPKTLRYDTRGKIDTTIPTAVQAKALIGKKVNLTLSNEGAVREVSNLEPIVNAILGKYRDSVPPAAVEQLRNGVKISLFQAIVLEMFVQSTPDTAIRAGSEWVRRDSVPMVLPIATVPSRVQVNYKVVEVRKVDDIPLGRLTMSMNTTFPEKSMEDKTGKATIDDAMATGSGEALVNLNTGFPIRKSTKMDMRLKLTGSTKTGPGAGKPTTLAQGKSTTTVVELLKYTPGE